MRPREFGQYYRSVAEDMLRTSQLRASNGKWLCSRVHLSLYELFDCFSTCEAKLCTCRALYHPDQKKAFVLGWNVETAAPTLQNECSPAPGVCGGGTGLEQTHNMNTQAQ
jgi:hypothetical protein